MCDKPQIGDECRFCDYEDFEKAHNSKLMATTSDGRFVDDSDSVWKYCEKIKKTVTVVKKASEIIKWCEEHGYTYGEFCMFHKSNINFYFEQIKHCGKECNNNYMWHEDWLEEKEI